MKKIDNVCEQVGEWKCPKCGSEEVSIAVDSLIGYWYAFCEVCEERGPDKDLLAFDEKSLTSQG